MRRWDLLKRVPKETLDFLAERARVSVLDDSTVQLHYVACQEWLRYVLPPPCHLCLPPTPPPGPPPRPPPPPFCVGIDSREAWVTMSLSLIMPEDRGFDVLAASFRACPGTDMPDLGLHCIAFL